jgi:hypothetical protein
LGCSPIKAVRELGLERRETVDIRAVYKFGYMLETPSIWWYSPEQSGSENPTSADNQQERPVLSTGILRDYMPNTISLILR